MQLYIEAMFFERFQQIVVVFPTLQCIPYLFCPIVRLSESISDIHPHPRRIEFQNRLHHQ